MFIKKKIKAMLGFKSLATMGKPICGIEIMHMVKKGQVDKIQSVPSRFGLLIGDRSLKHTLA